MIDGYVTLYTAKAGLEQFIAVGGCKAKLKADDTYCYEINVPRKAIQNIKFASKEPLPDLISIDILYGYPENS